VYKIITDDILYLFNINPSCMNFKNLKPKFPIDIVYSWAGENFSNNIRSSYNNELKYSLRSIYKFLPWVNHIYIIVNNRNIIPSWFNNNYKKHITMITEGEIFPRLEYIPNKNSNAIESCLHRIPQLNEHFIYLNDDFFIGCKLDYTYFFTEDGKAIVSDKINYPIKINKKRTKMKLPLTIRGFYSHTPYPYIKSQCKLFEENYKDYYHFIRKTKNRKGIGCNVCKNMVCPCQQVHGPIHIFMKSNDKVITRIEPNNGCSYRFFNHKNINTINKLLKRPETTFCINDTEINKDKRKENLKITQEFFEKMYPELPPWEK